MLFHTKAERSGSESDEEKKQVVSGIELLKELGYVPGVLKAISSDADVSTILLPHLDWYQRRRQRSQA